MASKGSGLLAMTFRRGPSSPRRFDLGIGQADVARLGVLELGQRLAEDEFDAADGPVAMFGDDDLGDVLLKGVVVVGVRPVDEEHDVGILFQAAGLSQVESTGRLSARCSTARASWAARRTG